MKKLAFFSLLLLLATACPDQPAGGSLSIKYGETVDVPNAQMKLTFTAVADSRCPKDVQCVTAGEGRVSLSVAKDGASEAIELMAKGLCHEEDGSCGSEATALGYQFKLLSLNPYPEADAQPGQEDYVVKLEYSAVQGN